MIGSRSVCSCPAAPATTAPAPAKRLVSFQQQVHDFVVTTTTWFQTHWLQIIIAAAIRG